MLTFNDSNIDLLEAVIFDADFHLSDLPKETDTGTITFKFRRPHWENQERTKRLFIKLTLVKEIFSQLTFYNVVKVQYNWKDDLYNKPGDHHSIYGAKTDSEKKTLTIDTGYLQAVFTFYPNYKVLLEDTSEPTSNNFLRIIGWKGMDYESWRTDYQTKTINAP